MIVEITNLTDAPGQRALEVRIFNTRLLPGKSARIPAQYVDSKMRALEEAGHIAIGAVPTWYRDHKSRRVLTADEVVASRKKAVEVSAAKAAAKTKFLDKKSPAPPPAPTQQLVVTEEAPAPTDSTEADTRPGKKNKNRR